MLVVLAWSRPTATAAAQVSPLTAPVPGVRRQECCSVCLCLFVFVNQHFIFGSLRKDEMMREIDRGLHRPRCMNIDVKSCRTNLSSLMFPHYNPHTLTPMRFIMTPLGASVLTVCNALQVTIFSTQCDVNKFRLYDLLLK